MNARVALVLCCLIAGMPAGAGSGNTEPAKVSREDLASAQYIDASSRWQTGQGTLDEVHAWSVRWAESQVASGKSGPWAAHRDRMRVLAEMTDNGSKIGAMPAHSVGAAQYFLVEAEAWIHERK